MAIVNFISRKNHNRCCSLGVAVGTFSLLLSAVSPAHAQCTVNDFRDGDTAFAGEVNANFDCLEQRNQQAQTQSNSNNAAIAANQQRLGAAESDIGTLDSRSAANSDSIGENSVAISKNANDITAVDNKATVAQSRSNSNTSRLNTLEPKVDTADQRSTSNESRIESLEAESGSSSAAQTGPVLITQQRAEEGGITSSDNPGFPVTIDSPGSYLLASNLLVEQQESAFKITAKFVSLDLGGFLIDGSNGTGVDGIQGNNASHLRVRNGSVVGFQGSGVRVGNLSAVDSVHVEAGTSGIETGISSRVSNCTVFGATGNGLSLFNRSMAFHNVISQSNTGITIDGRGNLFGNLIHNSTAAAISTEGVGSSRIYGNVISDSGGDGVMTQNNDGRGQNVLSRNSSGNTSAPNGVALDNDLCENRSC